MINVIERKAIVKAADIVDVSFFKTNQFYIMTCDDEECNFSIAERDLFKFPVQLKDGQKVTIRFTIED